MRDVESVSRHCISGVTPNGALVGSSRLSCDRQNQSLSSINRTQMGPNTTSPRRMGSTHAAARATRRRFEPRTGQYNPHRRPCGTAAESARGISPRAAHRSGLDTLASSGSCHRNEGCRLPPKIGAHPVASWLTPDVGDLPPLLHGHYPASSLLRGSPPLTGASVLSASRFQLLAPFPLASPARFSSSVQKPE
jgi:hypothetical protein